MTDLAPETSASTLHDPICLAWSGILGVPQLRSFRGVGFPDGRSFSSSDWAGTWALLRGRFGEFAEKNSLGLRVSITLSAPPPRGPVQQRMRRGTMTARG